MDAVSGTGVAGAVVVVLDGNLAGSTQTAGEDGTITLTGAEGNMNMEATATGYASARAGVGSCLMTGCSSSINFSLGRSSPWSRSGTASTAFQMPTDIRLVRITANYDGFLGVFAVWIGGIPDGRVVYELMGTFWGQTYFSGTFPTQGGRVDMEADNVRWTLTQVYR